MAIKAQAWSDFVVDFTRDVALEPEVILPKVKTLKKRDQKDDIAKWKLFVDGSSNQHGCGAGLVLQTSLVTTNEAEYEVLLTGLRVAVELEVESLDTFNDSQLVVN